ncbi:hypothetical protein F2Q69_00020783 [Brassica cretica]|uniref:Uncharacterized protein n=1 Tax=Brassica cretica TaxID=69181 RepID=A0A8S9Q1X6_BRACR|nr:hypothetical protein F2Q69_00020783 [Brassica cretica]
MCRRAEGAGDGRVSQVDLAVLEERELQEANEEAYTAADREEDGAATEKTEDRAATEETNTSTEP